MMFLRLNEIREWVIHEWVFGLCPDGISGSIRLGPFCIQSVLIIILNPKPIVRIIQLYPNYLNYAIDNHPALDCMLGGSI